MTATTPSLREAAQMALEALEQSIGYIEDAVVDHVLVRGENYRPLRLAAMRKDVTDGFLAIDSLRSALALPEAEPVAWLIPPEAYGDGLHSVMASDEYQENKDLLKAFPVYAAPVERKPLTKHEIHLALDTAGVSANGVKLDHEILVARAIEQAHGIRGES